MGNEVTRVDASNGSTTTHRFDLLIEDLTQRFVDFALNGNRIVLNLPAPKMGAFVGQFNFVSHYKFS
jgi:hypothetical protein